MLRLLHFLISLLTLINLVISSSTTGRRILVVRDVNTEINDYSLFWQSITDKGYDLQFRAATEISPLLINQEEYAFDHLILFAPESKNFPADLNPQNLYRYVEQKKNLIVVLSPNLSEFWRDFCREFEVEYDDRGQYVIDHFHYDQLIDDGSHTTLIVPLSSIKFPFASTSTIQGPPLLYRGIGHQVGRVPLLHNLIHAQASAYSCETKINEAPSEDPTLTGSDIGLVSSMQARNNARISFVGSLDIFSDAFALASVTEIDGTSHSKSGNSAFTNDLISWTFQESGILKVQRTAHAKAIDKITHQLYKVQDELVYEIEISTWQTDHWAPYSIPEVQLEFTMLDPHLRLSLLPSSIPSPNSTTFSSIFKIPDRHGVFTFNVDHRNAGWSYLSEKTVISVTPPRHDEFDRFITGALPYYTSALSVTLVVLIFIIRWILQ